MASRDALTAIEREIREEKAAALGRLGRELEARAAALRDHRNAPPPADAEGRHRYRRRLRVLEDEARLYLWYLIVQREAVGLRDHRDVERLYGDVARTRRE